MEPQKIQTRQKDFTMLALWLLWVIGGMAAFWLNQGNLNSVMKAASADTKLAMAAWALVSVVLLSFALKALVTNEGARERNSPKP